MTGAAAVALLSHWRRNPLQLLTLLGGLALATALWSAVQAINAEARASYAEASSTLGDAGLDILTAPGGTIAEQVYVDLRRAGWIVTPLVEGEIAGVRILGIDPLTAAGGPAEAVTGTADLGAFLMPPGQLIGRADVFARIGDLGPVPVLSDDVPDGTVVTDIGVAQRLLGSQGQITRLVVLPDQPSRQAPLAGIAPGLIRTNAGADPERLTESFHLNLTAFGLLSFAVGLFIVHGAIGLALAQRRPVVRTLRALGLPLRTIVVLMVAELGLLALLSGGIGVVLGYLIAAALLPDVASSLQSLYGAEVAGSLTLRAGWWLSGLAIAVGGTLLAAARGLWTLARLPLLSGAAPQAQSLQAKWRRMGMFALVLLAAAGVLGWRADGLIGGFAFLASLMIGSALALPPLLSGILRIAAGQARGAVAQWFWADSQQQLPAISLALMALMLAMAANIGVATMVSSFRLTFIGFLDQRLASDLYISATDEDEATRLTDYLTGRVDAVLPLLSVERPLAGGPAELFGARDHATYRDNWRFLFAHSDVWDRIATGDGVIVNEQLARRADLGLGDPLDVGVTLPIVGIYGDYGNPVGQAVIGETLFTTLYPQVRPVRFGVRIDPTRSETLRAGLTGDFGLPPQAIVDQAAIKAVSLSVFERTFAVTGALNVLTLAVAGFAMLMSLLTLATMRLPQLAPVWALGLTRRGLARAEFGRALALAGLTGVVAVPVGLALAWGLLAVVNVAAFGWKLPMYLFPLDYIRLFLLSLIAAALAAAVPAWRLRRVPPARLLKVFADER